VARGAWEAVLAQAARTSSGKTSSILRNSRFIG